MNLTYSHLTEPQHRLLARLAKAAADDPPGWVLLVPKLNRLTERRLVNLDLIMVGHVGGCYARISGRGLRYYRDVSSRGPATPRYDDATVDRILDMISTGLKYVEIAREIGCTESYVSLLARGGRTKKYPNRYAKALTRRGQEPVRRKCHPHPAHVRQQVVEMRRNGSSYKAIQAAVGVAMGTIGRWCKAADLLTEGYLDEAQRREIIRLTLAGMTQQQVADHIGRSVRPVKDTMKAYYAGLYD